MVPITPTTEVEGSYDPFAGPEIERVIPSTEAQRELWLADQLAPDASLAYSEAAILRFTGSLDVTALRTALTHVISRHDALRVLFSVDGESLLVTTAVDSAAAALAEFGPADASLLAKVTRRAVATPWNLSQGPLFRAQLVTTMPNEHALILAAHHCVCDGWSWGVLMQDLAESYAAVAAGSREHRPLPTQFSEHAQLISVRGVADASVDYWFKRHTPLPAPLELPIDQARPLQRNVASLREDIEIPLAVAHGLKDAAKHHGVSVFSLMLSAFVVLLGRISGQDDLVIGVPTAGQPAAGHPDMIGHCVHTLPLRFNVQANDAFKTFLAQANGELLDAIDHQDCTLSTLLQQLAVPRDPARVPLASVLFNVDQALDGLATAFPGVSVDYTTIPRVADNFELSVNAVATARGMRIECQYSTALFTATTIRRWLSAYVTLLGDVLARPDVAIWQLQLMDTEALNELQALQPPPSEYPRQRLMHQHFELSCDATPLAVAARDHSGQMTYCELDAAANRIAYLLHAHGVKRGALVALAMDRDCMMLAALLGVLKAGAAYIPMDSGFPAARLQHMLEDGGAVAVLTTSALAGHLPSTCLPVISLDDETLIQQPSDRLRLADPPTPEAAAYMIYTSGSTGHPKGVAVPHQAVSNFLTSMLSTPGMGPNDVLVAVTTLSFDIAVLELLLPLSAGGTVVIAERETSMDGERLSGLLTQSGATVLQATPATWRMLLLAGWKGGAGFRALCGGEALPPPLAASLLDCCGEVWNLYGPTETTIWSTCARVVPAHARDLPDVHIGQPIANTEAWILDPEGQPCLRGVTGELCIAGDGLALGYHRRPELTSERFIDWSGAGQIRRLYRTGDRARWRSDDQLEHQGRLDYQVKVRGYRIELGEIESRLVAHAGVQSAVTIVREDVVGDVRLVAYVLPVVGEAPTSIELRQHLQADLPDYMVPQHFILMDAWPLTANGKLDRKSLPPPTTETTSTHTVVAPETSLQRNVLEVFERVLGIAAIGIDDDFFLSGGHSLLAAQLTSQLNRTFGVKLSLRSIFDAPTVRKLSTAIELARHADAGAAAQLIPRRADQSWAPLSDAQNRHAMLQQYNPDSVIYNAPSGHRLRGQFNIEVFQRALSLVMERHAVMCSSIGLRDGQRVQQMDRLTPPGGDQVIDLSHLDPQSSERIIARDMDRLVAQPFDLGKPPLFKSRLYKLADEEHVWFFMPHHVIWDGWSFDILYMEMAEACSAIEAGREADLPALPISFGDYAEWHNGWLRGAEYAAQLAHWKRLLSPPNGQGGWPEYLPTDYPRQRTMTGRAHHLHLVLSDALLAQLHERARAHETTVFVLCLAAYCATLAHHAQACDLIIGTPVRGRNHAETESLIGDFVNLLPVRVDVDPAFTLLELLARVRMNFLDALSAPDIRLDDLGRIQAALPKNVDRVLYHALFSYQDVRQRPTRWGSLSHSRIPVAQQGATEDLGLWFVEEPGMLTGGLAYNEGLFKQPTIERLYARYLHALERFASAPDLDVATLYVELGGIEVAAALPKSDPISTPPSTDRMANNKREQYIIELWHRHLHVEVMPDDNFFDLGGTSLVAMQMADELARASGFKLKLPELAVQTAAQLAAQLPASMEGEPSEGGWLKRMFRR